MIDFGMQTGTLRSWLAETPARVRGAMSRALRRTGTAVQRTAIELFRQRGVGRTIFGQKPSGARALISRSKLRVREGEMEQPITLKGLAAIQETGGRTRPHEIKPKNADRLAFQVGGRTVVVPFVNHPGGQMPALPFARRAADTHRSTLHRELDAELAKLRESR